MAIDKLVDSTQLDADLTSVANAIRAKGGTSAELAFPQEFIVAINDIPAGGGQVEIPDNDVVFIDDYAQRICYAYTKEQFLQLESMPPNPTHDGMTSLGWNWTLTDAQEHVRKYEELVIGQEYRTSDGCTHIQIRILHPDTLTYRLSFRQTVEDGVIVNWGDGSQPQTFGRTYVVDNMFNNIEHTYNETGNYDITLKPINSEVRYSIGNAYPGYSQGILFSYLEGVLCGSGLHSFNYLNYYAISCSVKRFVFNSSVLIQQLFSADSSNNGNFNGVNCKFLTIPSECNLPNLSLQTSSLQYVSLPKTQVSYTSYFLQHTPAIKKITLPGTVSGGITLSNQTGLMKIKTIYFPQNVTDASVRMGSNYSLKKVLVKRDLQSLNNNAFYLNGGGGRIYDFTSCTSVPTIPNTSVLGGLNAYDANSQIRVPKVLQEQWKTATNWTSYAQYIVGVQ